MLRPCVVCYIISIHAPHTGRDSLQRDCAEHHIYFNPRAPYGARLCPLIHGQSIIIFQSTRPIRGATFVCPISCKVTENFNPRAPYGARRDYIVEIIHDVRISIHAPHTGRDRNSKLSRVFSLLFQSTRPIRGATILGQCRAVAQSHSKSQ